MFLDSFTPYSCKTSSNVLHITKDFQRKYLFSFHHVNDVKYFASWKSFSSYIHRMEGTIHPGKMEKFSRHGNTVECSLSSVVQKCSTKDCFTLLSEILKIFLAQVVKQMMILPCTSNSFCDE
ncbi:CLUMA_CG018533, isoform A [Clunio marinus]|uniref:CLUMA_CG018533, isoform A n=1 Tax=Clunio marinus TaxID=568069 RepID=A0A1J1J1V5_9DIPT|nr:CLUMA_CG018533, isoform A [Clunio marinus]